jgi:hypothetical protein
MSAQTQTPRPPGERSDPDGPPPDGHSAPAHALRDALARFAQLREFVAYYLAVRIDSLKVSIRNAGLYAAVAVLALLGTAAMIVTAVVLLLVGVAGAFAELFPGHPWLGDIITAAIFLGVVAVGLWLGMKMLTNSFRRYLVQKYERRQSRQRQQFGSDIRQEAERTRT